MFSVRKSISFLLISVMFSLVSFSQKPNETTTPIPRTDEYLKDEYPHLFADLNGNVDLSKVKIAFVGNSITMQWKTNGAAIWDPYFNTESSPYYAINLGVSGDHTQHVLYRLLPKSENGMGNFDSKDLNLSLIVLEIGTNHLWSDTIPEIIKGINACVDRLLEIRPSANLLLLSVMPTNDNKINDKVDELNHQLSLLYKNKTSRVTYLNTNKNFRDSKGNAINYYFTDGVHLSSEGYKLWFELIKPTLDSILNSDHTNRLKLISSSQSGVAADHQKNITLTFNQSINPRSLKYIKIYNNSTQLVSNKNRKQNIKGKWEFIDPKTISFQSKDSLKPGEFYSISFENKFKSIQGSTLENGIDYLSFITDNKTHYGFKETILDTFHLDGDHVLPLKIRTPYNKEKTPVYIFVHGGGWLGGTLTESIAAYPTGYFTNYFVNKMGIAVVGVAYRCKGSNGNFTIAKKDIEKVVDYIKQNATKYNFDTSKIIIGGESAGAPLSAIIAQNNPSIKYYIGINGIYDFINNNTAKFGQGNYFGQLESSAEFNSAMHNIRQNPPITLLIHGDKDDVIHDKQSIAFHKAIKKNGGISYLKIYKGQPHWDFYAPGGKYEISTLYQMIKFFNQHLR